MTTDSSRNGVPTCSSAVTLSYDALGRLASKGADGCTGRPAESFEYDPEGHLTRVVRGGVEAERLWYGPSGELLYRQVGEKFAFYVGEYATVTALGAAGCSGTGSCQPVAGTMEVDAHLLLAGTRIASVKSSRVLYYYRTRLGTVVATSLGGGLPGARYRYTPYGEVDKVENETAATRSELLYANYLSLTGGLYHMPARIYDARLKAFLQADEVDRYRYAYAAGDPVNGSDPTGLEPFAYMWEGFLLMGYVNMPDQFGTTVVTDRAM